MGGRAMARTMGRSCTVCNRSVWDDGDNSGAGYSLSASTRAQGLPTAYEFRRAARAGRRHSRQPTPVMLLRILGAAFAPARRTARALGALAPVLVVPADGRAHRAQEDTHVWTQPGTAIVTKAFEIAV